MLISYRNRQKWSDVNAKFGINLVGLKLKWSILFRIDFWSFGYEQMVIRRELVCIGHTYGTAFYLHRKNKTMAAIDCLEIVFSFVAIHAI